LDLGNNHFERAAFPWHCHALVDVLAFGVGELAADGRDVVEEFSHSSVAAKEFFVAKNAPAEIVTALEEHVAEFGLDLAHEAAGLDTRVMLADGFGNSGSSGALHDSWVGGRCGRRNEGDASVENLKACRA
jgi:hypothetical protein